MSHEHYYALILAGGGGTRLWPKSRKDTPKQLLALIDERTLFKTSVDRLLPILPPEHIYVVTGPDYAEQLKADVPELPERNFVIEPYGRDNAPATALALSVIHKRDPEATIALLASDHHIAREDAFRELLGIAHDIAQDGYIVTLGISPTFPATSFGYIKQGSEHKKVNGYTCYEAVEFTEKPNIVTATNFLATGLYSWNSGMFIWKASTAMREFERQQPAIYKLLEVLQPIIDTDAYDSKLKEIWEEMPRTSIDFAIMEGAEKMVVLPVDIGWSDVGSWSSLFDVLKLDKFGNCFRGSAPERIILDTNNTMVYSDRLVVTIGIDDVIVIDTDDVLMICHKKRDQEVREVVNHLRKIKKQDYL